MPARIFEMTWADHLLFGDAIHSDTHQLTLAGALRNSEFGLDNRGTRASGLGIATALRLGLGHAISHSLDADEFARASAYGRGSITTCRRRGRSINDLPPCEAAAIADWMITG